MRIVKFISKYIKKYKVQFFIYVLLSALNFSLLMIIPYISGNYIDELIQFKSKTTIYRFTKLIIILDIARVTTLYYLNTIATKFKTKVSTDLNFVVLQHVNKIPLLKFDNNDTVYLNQRINSDSHNVAGFVISTCVELFVKIGTLTLSLFIIFIINIKISLMLVLILPIYVLIYFSFKRPLYNSTYKFKEAQAKLFSDMNRQLYNVKIIKLNSWFETLKIKLNESFIGFFNILTYYIKITNLFSSLSSFSIKLSKVVLFFWGGLEIINGRLTIGKFTIINIYFNMLIDCTNYFLNLGKSYQSSLVSYMRLKELLDTKKESNGNENLKSIETIQLKNVSFSYINNDILDNFNYTFNKGRIYGILGKNGSGKSTFINLVLGLFDNKYSGDIKYNMTNIKELDMYSIREKLIGISEQEPTLMGDSIISNLIYGLHDAKQEELIKWCTKIGIYDFIKNLPNSFNSNLQENSSNISGGEKQKISLARIFIKNPDVIILDEPTSALDKESINRLKIILNEIKNDKIVIVVTHDLNIIDVMDETINFDSIRIF